MVSLRSSNSRASYCFLLFVFLASFARCTSLVATLAQAHEKYKNPREPIIFRLGRFGARFKMSTEAEKIYVPIDPEEAPDEIRNLRKIIKTLEEDLKDGNER